jgi:branched-chain amino acid transport system substrate-binding protein
MKFYHLLTLLIVLSVVLVACGPAATGGEDIKIAMLAPLSGPVPTFGTSGKNGGTMAVDEWNAKGGVLGKKIKLIVEDSQCTPDPAVNAANKVIDQDKVKYIVGETCSKASIPVSEIAEKKGVVMITPTSTNATVTKNQDGTTKNYVFRACFIDPFQGTVAAKFAIGKGFKTAFIMLDQGNDYVRGLAEAFEAAFVKNGGTIVGKETYTSQDTDFSAILTKVGQAKPDVLYVPDYYNIINLVGKQAKEKGITAPMMGGDGWDSADLDKSAAEGGFYTNHYSPDDTRAVVQDWVKKYKEKYGAVPDALATLGYDATNMMIEAIKQAGADDPVKVKDTLATGKFELVSGSVTLDKDHNPIKSAVVLQVKDGKISFVESVAP